MPTNARMKIRGQRTEDRGQPGAGGEFLRLTFDHQLSALRCPLSSVLCPLFCEHLLLKEARKSAFIADICWRYTSYQLLSCEACLPPSKIFVA